MAKSIEQKLLACPYCERKTLHYKNSNGVHWFMHLTLLVATMGAWSVILLLTIIFKPLNRSLGEKWICSVCGSEHSGREPWSVLEIILFAPFAFMFFFLVLILLISSWDSIVAFITQLIA